MISRKGFTLAEILVAVIIVAILAVMAMPLYEKTIERSHLAEARTIMNRLQEAKWNAMDNMECDNYVYSSEEPVSCPRLEHLRVAFTTKDGTTAKGRTFQTKYFQYSLSDAGDTYRNGICAKRIGGDNDGTVFAYYGLRRDKKQAEFKCKGSSCEDYGFSSTDGLNCTF